MVVAKTKADPFELYNTPPSQSITGALSHAIDEVVDSIEDKGLRFGAGLVRWVLQITLIPLGIVEVVARVGYAVIMSLKAAYHQYRSNQLAKDTPMEQFEKALNCRRKAKELGVDGAGKTAFALAGNFIGIFSLGQHSFTTEAEGCESRLVG